MKHFYLGLIEIAIISFAILGLTMFVSDWFILLSIPGTFYGIYLGVMAAKKDRA